MSQISHFPLWLQAVLDDPEHGELLNTQRAVDFANCLDALSLEQAEKLCRYLLRHDKMTGALMMVILIKTNKPIIDALKGTPGYIQLAWYLLDEL